MAWVESHDNLGDHPKTFRLVGILNIPIQQAVGAVTLLHHFTIRFAWRDGNLVSWGDVAIARGAKWDADPMRFVNALREAKFMCGGNCQAGRCHDVDQAKKTFVHDWLFHASKLIQDRVYNEEKRIGKSRRYQNTAEKRRFTGATNPTNPTLPTLPNTMSAEMVGFDFESVWSRYPSKTGRRAAERHFGATVKTAADLTAINRALDNYLASARVAKGFIQNGSTWFNDWQAWVDFKEPKRNGAARPRPGQPDFKPDSIDNIVLSYRKATGVPESDKEKWNEAFWDKNRTQAEALYKYFGNVWEDAAACVDYVVADLQKAGIPCTMKMVFDRAPQFKNGGKR